MLELYLMERHQHSVFICVFIYGVVSVRHTRLALHAGSTCLKVGEFDLMGRLMIYAGLRRRGAE